MLVGVHVVNAADRSVLFDPTALELGVLRRGKTGYATVRAVPRATVAARTGNRHKWQRIAGAMAAGMAAAQNGQYAPAEVTTGTATIHGPGGTATVSGTSPTSRPKDTSAEVAAHQERAAQLGAADAAARMTVESTFLAEQTLDARQSVIGYVAFPKQKNAIDFVFVVPVSGSAVVVAMQPLNR